MASCIRPRLFMRLIPIAALLPSLVLSFGTVLAAAPTVTANPALVPFSAVPGQPGVTTLTFTAGGTTGLTACGQDNTILPTFPLGAVDANTPLVVNFPFIQAGKYTFWVSSDASCDAAKKLQANGAPVQATASRLGPTGVAAQDAVLFRQTGQTNFFSPGSSGNTNSFDLILLGLAAPFGGPVPDPPMMQTFPIPGVQVCMMSGDGTQLDIAMKVGQDSRPVGLGTAAATTTVIPFAGQNGCFDVPWVVNGGYTASITRSGAASSFGYCATGFVADQNKPGVPPTATIGKCAQVAFFPDRAQPQPSGATVNGSIVTGADNHAVQVCISAFSAAPVLGNPPPIQQLANTVNAYNQSGAVNLTPIKLAFRSGTVAEVVTYDITGTGPGGQGGAQFVCPPATAKQSAGNITTITFPDVPNATIIDQRGYVVQ